MTDVEKVLSAWRNRLPNNAYAWPGAPETFAAEAVRVLASHWRSIDTAPNDGTPVLLGFPGNLHAMAGHFEMEYWGELNSDFEFVPFSVRPTHWMHLPEPPGPG